MKKLCVAAGCGLALAGCAAQPVAYDPGMESEARRLIAETARMERAYGAPQDRDPLASSHVSAGEWDGHPVTCGTVEDRTGRRRAAIDVGVEVRLTERPAGDDPLFRYVWSRAGC